MSVPNWPETRNEMRRKVADKLTEWGDGYDVISSNVIDAYATILRVQRGVGDGQYRILRGFWLGDIDTGSACVSVDFDGSAEAAMCFLASRIYNN